MPSFGQLVRDRVTEVTGRYGQELQNVVWPTPEVRFVSATRFHPHSGEPQICIRAIGPEICERPNAKIKLVNNRSVPHGVEVLFSQQEHQLATAFQEKCCITLATAVVEKQQYTRDAFYNRACTLLANDLHKGRMQPGKRVVQIEHEAQEQRRSRVARKSF